MSNIKVTLEYDGTRFSGFQKQKNHRTVQGEFERALAKLFQNKVRLVASGRTDSGVHAEAQVVNFRIHSKIPPPKIQLALNHYLPEDLAVTAVEKVRSDFHSRYSPRAKVYEYQVFHSKSRSPLNRFRTYHVPYPLNLAKMRLGARLLSGRHNFRAFESSGGRRLNSIRTIQRFQIQKKGKIVSFTIRSNGFLYKMARSVVGTLLEVGSGRLKLSGLKQILATKDRSLVGPTVPARGLTLKRVMY